MTTPEAAAQFIGSEEVENGTALFIEAMQNEAGVIRPGFLSDGTPVAVVGHDEDDRFYGCFVLLTEQLARSIQMGGEPVSIEEHITDPDG